MLAKKLAITVLGVLAFLLLTGCLNSNRNRGNPFPRHSKECDDDGMGEVWVHLSKANRSIEEAMWDAKDEFLRLKIMLTETPTSDLHENESSGEASGWELIEKDKREIRRYLDELDEILILIRKLRCYERRYYQEEPSTKRTQTSEPPEPETPE